VQAVFERFGFVDSMVIGSMREGRPQVHVEI
jgi:hypothetical protein